MTLSESISNFLNCLGVEKKACSKTLQNYQHYLGRFLDFAGDKNLAEIDLHIIRRYRLYLSAWIDPITKSPLQKKTQNYFLIALRSLLKYLTDRNLIELDIRQIWLTKVPIEPVLSLDETIVEKLLQTPNLMKKHGLRDKALMEVLFATGLKVSEVASLNKDNLDLRRGLISFVGKNNHTRITILTESAQKWLIEYLGSRKDSFQPLFIRHKLSSLVDLSNNGEKMRLSIRGIQRIVKKHAKRAGIKLHTTPHVLRHSFATRLINQGADMKVIQESLGYAHYISTLNYTSLIKKSS